MGKVDLGVRTHDLMVAVRSTRRFSVSYMILWSGRVLNGLRVAPTPGSKVRMKVAQLALETLGAAREDTGLGE